MVILQGLIGTVLVAALFAGLGSVTPLGGVTFAVMVAPVCGLPKTVVSRKQPTEPPEGNVGMTNPLSSCAAVGLFAICAPPSARQLTWFFLTEGELGTVIVAPSAAIGPSLTTATRYWTGLL